MAINFKPDDKYKVDGVTTVPRTYEGESLAYISDEEALLLREKGGGVPPNDSSGQITKFGIPSFQNIAPWMLSGGVQRHDMPGRSRWIFNNKTYTNQADAQAAHDKLLQQYQQQQAAQPQNVDPLPLVVGDADATEPFNKSVNPTTPPTTAPPAYLSQPMPPGQEGQKQDLLWYKQNQDWVEQNWVKNPEYEQWLQENPPSATPADEPPEQRQARGLTIEERNQRVLDIMSAQATSPVHPPNTKVELSPIELQQEELLASQQMGQVTPITSDVTGAVPEIGVQGEFEAAQTEAARTEEIDRARAARLAREDISPEVFVQEADVIGTVSEQSLAQAQADNLDPKATVQGQLENLYTSIIDGQPLPPWASGPVRAASQIMQQRGLGASSIAGAALVQAVQESAIPIAAADAQAYGTIQLQNLNNSQQAALQNALTFAQMDQRNQDARMRSAIQNSQNFLSIDVQNLNNDQQKEVLDFNTRAQEMFSNQAAANAANQFNAQSQNQIDQFFANLGTQVSQRNSELQVAQEQFNVDQVNTVKQFNQSLLDSRDKFNANLTAQINQSNAVWRRTINTANNATQNEANRINAQNLLGLTSTAQNNLWQAYRDEAQWLIQTTENGLQRAHQAAILSQQQNFQDELYQQSVKDNAFSAIGSLAGTIVGGLFAPDSGTSIAGRLFSSS